MKKNIYIILCLTFTLMSFSKVKPDEDLINLKKISPDHYTTKDLTAKQTSKGIEVLIKSGVKGMIKFSPTDKYWDLTDWAFISIELENKTAQEIRFDSEILYDNPKRPKKFKKVKNKHIGFVHATENLVYNCVLIRDQITNPDYPQKKDFPGMKGIPTGIITEWAGIDAKHIKGFRVVFPSQDFERKIIIKRLFKNKPSIPELYAKDKEAFFPFINKYGQYKHADWEGKITDDKQFAEAIKKEKKDLKTHKGSKEWNKYGGYAKGPKYKATGHFRTEKINGRWWIIDPTGSLFWSTGVNSAGRLTISTPIKNREHFFEGLPERNDENKVFYQKKSYLHGKANLYRKYGKNSEDKYVEVSLNRMKSWGFNTLGGWSTENVSQFPKEIRLPYTLYVDAIHPAINEKFPDVFDPRWKTNIEKVLQKKEALKQEDPYLFGIFINNEIHWSTPMGLAANSLAKGKNSAGKKEYIKRLKEGLSSIEAFNQLTGGKFKSWEALLNTKVKKGTLDVYPLKKINIAHYENMCEVYFKTTKELLNKYAPNKMYLGCRWHGNHKNGFNIPIAAKYLDILTFNAYENEVEFYPFPQKNIDKPFIVSEFNFGSLDRGKFYTGLGYASNQRNRGEKYVNFIEGALRNPRCVGAHWFMWANSTTAGRGNGENASCGLVSMTDQVYYELISYMRKINYKLYDYGLEKVEK